MRNTILAAWLDTMLAMRLDTPGLQRRRAQLWRRLAAPLAATPMFAPRAGRPLDAFPVLDPAALRQSFGAANSLGLAATEAFAAAADAERGGTGLVRTGVIAGLSTGTSGQRGLFVASPAERARYVGQSLAKLLPPRMLVTGGRIALFLRANSSLYSDVATAGRFRFRHFPLDLPPARKLLALREFAPDTLVAPAHVLAELAGCIEDGAAPIPTIVRLFDGGEPMGDAERQWLAGPFGVRPRSIYQATEGFLAATCRYGRLHLNEDSLAVELEPIEGTTAFRPIVTDLMRTSQPIVRVRLDDVVEPTGELCACGFAGRVIRPVAGRITDIWTLGDRHILPATVAGALEQGLGPRAEWVATGSPTGVAVSLRDGRFADAAVQALEQLLIRPLPISIQVSASLIDTPKRRRVRWESAHG